MSMFRKPGDGSSSEEDTSNTQEETSAVDDLPTRVNTLDSASSAPLARQSGANSPPTRPGMSRTNTGSNVRDLLLHSLLEDKALTEAAEHLGKEKSDPEVLALARQTYRELARQFSSQIGENYASDEMRQQRAAASAGINRATRMHMTRLPTAATATGTIIAADASQALIPRSFLGLPVDSPSKLSHDMETLNDLYLQLPPSVQGHTGLHSNRYAREYEEIEMIGKGGYGKVYKAKHKLDDAYYAVKRIIISANKLQKIRERGDQELLSILEEVRSLARFDHNNIVRYHSAWMEFMTEPTAVPVASATHVVPSNLLLGNMSESSFSSGAPSQLQTSFDALDLDDPFERSNHDSGDGIIFETSDIDAGVEEAKGETYHALWKGKERKGKERRGSQATVATISSTKSRLSAVEDVDEEEEEDIESIPRTQEQTFEGSDSMVTDSDAPNQMITTRVSGPVLTLNVQMSLYDANLSEFLSNGQQAPHHCFHPCVSLELLGKIVKGVEYLHASGVVHRDLKPANIFLSLSTSRVSPTGSVDLAGCRFCPERECMHVTPRIGDFGLVAALGDAATKPVGTEFYRPLVTSKNSDKLDVFALGVVAFEMLQKFGTRMERVDALTKLRRGEFVEGFAAGCGEFREKVQEMVRGMVEMEEEKRWNCEDVRREIAKIVSGLKV